MDVDGAGRWRSGIAVASGAWPVSEIDGGAKAAASRFPVARRGSVWNTIEFLQHLQHWLGRRLPVILDRLPIHRNDIVREFVDRTDEIRLELLPPYAPDLNPADPANAAYYDVSLENRLTYGVFYLGLVAFLAIMTYDLHAMLGKG